VNNDPLAAFNAPRDHNAQRARTMLGMRVQESTEALTSATTVHLDLHGHAGSAGLHVLQEAKQTALIQFCMKVLMCYTCAAMKRCSANHSRCSLLHTAVLCQTTAETFKLCHMPCVTVIPPVLP
jgi:hypothetical protein